MGVEAERAGWRASMPAGCGGESFSVWWAQQEVGPRAGPHRPLRRAARATRPGGCGVRSGGRARLIVAGEIRDGTRLVSRARAALQDVPTNCVGSRMKMGASRSHTRVVAQASLRAPNNNETDEGTHVMVMVMVMRLFVQSAHAFGWQTSWLAPARCRCRHCSLPASLKSRMISSQTAAGTATFVGRAQGSRRLGEMLVE